MSGVKLDLLDKVKFTVRNSAERKEVLKALEENGYSVYEAAIAAELLRMADTFGILKKTVFPIFPYSNLPDVVSYREMAPSEILQHFAIRDFSSLFHQEIDWDKGPDWAMYHAYDLSGRGFWSSHKPASHIHSGEWVVLNPNGLSERSPYVKPIPFTEWDKSLVMRPHAKGDKSSTEPVKAPPIEKTQHERAKTYGKFSDLAKISQNLKSVMRNTPNWDKLKPNQKEALEMVMHKVARILNGDPDYADSWHDLGGYSGLIDKYLNGKDI